MEDAFQLGVNLALAARCLPFGSITKMAGVAATMQRPEAADAKRLVIKAAHDLMISCGDGYTAPARHLEILSSMPKWSSHAADVYSTIVQSCMAVQELEKRAFTDAIEGAGALAKGIGYAGVGGGMGLGALYWMLSRHATQDEADIAGKKHQLQYYRGLNKELQDSLRQKYRYEPPVA